MPPGESRGFAPEPGPGAGRESCRGSGPRAGGDEAARPATPVSGYGAPPRDGRMTALPSTTTRAATQWARTSSGPTSTSGTSRPAGSRRAPGQAANIRSSGARSAERTESRRRRTAAAMRHGTSRLFRARDRQSARRGGKNARRREARAAAREQGSRGDLQRGAVTPAKRAGPGNWDVARREHEPRRCLARPGRRDGRERRRERRSGSPARAGDAEDRPASYLRAPRARPAPPRAR